MAKEVVQLTMAKKGSNFAHQALAFKLTEPGTGASQCWVAELGGNAAAGGRTKTGIWTSITDEKDAWAMSADDPEEREVFDSRDECDGFCMEKGVAIRTYQLLDPDPSNPFTCIGAGDCSGYCQWYVPARSSIARAQLPVLITPGRVAAGRSTSAPIPCSKGSPTGRRNSVR
jgi:hypothetical protein